MADSCPSCGAPNSIVRDSRPVPDHPCWRRRRRQCLKCGIRWNTLELPEEDIAAFPELRSTLEAAIRALTSLKDKISHEPLNPAATGFDPDLSPFLSKLRPTVRSPDSTE